MVAQTSRGVEVVAAEQHPPHPLRTKFDQLRLKVGDAKTSVFSKTDYAILALGVGLYIAARLWQLTSYSLWMVEIFSVQAARLGWNDMMAFLVGDVVHPPLFYVLLKLWMGIGGESLLWLKLLPVLFSIAAILPFLMLCRELKLSAGVTNLALVLMAANSYLIYYAQEVRMYSMLFFLALCSMWLFVRFFNSSPDTQRNLLMLFAVNLLMVYTQYYGWLVVGVEGLFLLVWGRRKLLSFVVSVIGLILCFCPWLYAVTQAAKPQLEKGGLADNLGWLPRPTLFGDLRIYYSTLNGFFSFPLDVLQLLLFGLPLLLWAWHLFAKKSQGQNRDEAAAFWWLALAAFLPVAICFVASQILPQSVWHPRYLIIVAAPYLILIAIAVQRLRPQAIRSAAVLLVVGWAALAGVRAMRPENVDRLKWKQLVRHMIATEKTIEQPIKIYAIHEGRGGQAVNYYLEEAQEQRFQVEKKDLEDIVSEDTTKTASSNHFWVFGFNPQKQNEARKVLTENGYRIGEGFEDRHKLFALPVWRSQDAASPVIRGDR